MLIGAGSPFRISLIDHTITLDALRCVSLRAAALLRSLACMIYQGCLVHILQPV
jgi:hypothetical protein